MSISLHGFWRRNRLRLLLCALLLGAFIAFFWQDMVISIHSGEGGVRYSRFFGGTQLDHYYTEGLYIIPPWDKLTVYDLRMRQETRHVEALTKEGLPVQLDISLRYQLIANKLPLFHQQIGQEFTTKIITPLITSVVRQVAGSYKVGELYSVVVKELEDSLLIDAAEAMGRIPVRLLAFVVEQVTLPDDLTQSIAKKLISEQRVLQYAFLQEEAAAEAKRKAIEGEGIRYYQKLVSSGMSPAYLRYEGIKATEKLAESSNAKLVMIGGQDGLPLVFNTASSAAPVPAAGKKDAAEPAAEDIFAGGRTLPQDWPVSTENVQQFMQHMDTMTGQAASGK